MCKLSHTDDSASAPSKTTSMPSSGSGKHEANLIVIGAGSAGLVSAYIAAAVQAKVILIEKHKMGGDCLNTGCVPSKALLKSAKLASNMRNSDKHGLHMPQELQVKFPQVMARVKNVISAIEPHDSVERYTELGVECVQGEATIIDKNTVQVGDRVMTAKNLILAAGARPFVPPIPGLADVNYLTSDSIWNLQELPKRLTVLGGGPIGCEMAQAFAKLGSEVTIVELAPQLMGREDPDVAKLIKEEFEATGVRVLVQHKAVQVQDGIVTCEMAETGEQVQVPYDQLLVAVGRKANTDRLPGLEGLGMKLRRNGTIETDAYLRSSVSNIYACGDITGPFQFTHTAAHQAWYCAVNALFGPFKMYKVNYDVIPWATFTSPEVARVGLNETEAAQSNQKYQVSTYDMNDLDRAICDGTDRGFVKVLTKGNTDQILGVTIVHEHASDLIAEYVLAMKHKIGLNKILGTIHLYPSNAEANKYVAGVWKKQNKPEKLLKWVQKFHAWRR